MTIDEAIHDMESRARVYAMLNSMTVSNNYQQIAQWLKAYKLVLRSKKNKVLEVDG